MDDVDLLIEWENGQRNVCSQKDLLPSIETGSHATWVYDTDWYCQIKVVIDDENIIVTWDKDLKENTLSLADLCIRVEEKEVYWRYDRSWKGTQQAALSSAVVSGSSQAIRYQTRRRKDVNLLTDYDTSEDEACSDGSSASDESTNESILASNSEEDVPLVLLRGRGSEPRKDRILWRESQNELIYPPFLSQDESEIHQRSVFEYFKDYFTEEFMTLVCEQNNLYAHQKNPNSTFDMDFQLFRKFTSASLMMSLFNLSSSRRFWSVGSRIAFIADCISRQEFEKVKQNLHFVDNSSYVDNPEPGYKFKPLIQHFNKVCQKLPKTEKMSIDEQILPTKTKKSKFRQYNQKKPKKWGFKIFMITDPSGLVYKIEFPTESLEFPTDNQMKRNGRGSIVEKQCTLENNHVVSAMKWFDNRGVHLVSNYMGSFPVQQIERYDRCRGSYITIDCPAAVKEYNAFMGGIDAFDSYIALYRTRLRSTKKYYLKIYFHIIDMMIINAWLLCRRDSLMAGEPKKSLPKLWDFKYEIAQTLAKFQEKIPRKRFSNVSFGIMVKRHRGPVAALPTDDVRRDGNDHLPMIKQKGRCKNPDCKSIIKTFCTKCAIHLCVSEKNCFYNFHTN